MKDNIKEILWMLIEQHYSVNRSHPHVLTAKRPYNSNQINQIGDDLFDAFMQMIVLLEEREREKTKKR